MVVAAVLAVAWMAVAVPVAVLIARLIGRDHQREREHAEWTRMSIELDSAALDPRYRQP